MISFFFALEIETVRSGSSANAPMPPTNSCEQNPSLPECQLEDTEAAFAEEEPIVEGDIGDEEGNEDSSNNEVGDETDGEEDGDETDGEEDGDEEE